MASTGVVLMGVGGLIALVGSVLAITIVLGTLIALRHPGLRTRENLLARESSLYCSAFVQHLFRKAGIDLAPGVHDKNTTPEDISRTTVPHMTYLLKREPPTGVISEVRAKLRRRVQTRIDKIKEVRRKIRRP